jgi:hypothetical protein
MSSARNVFPDLPSYLDAQIAAMVERLCRRYGILYTTRSFVRQVGSVARRLLRLALPHAPVLFPRGLMQPFAGRDLASRTGLTPRI